MRPLMLGQIMEALVRVFSQHQPREQPCRFLRRSRPSRRPFRPYLRAICRRHLRRYIVLVTIFSVTAQFVFTHRLQIHLAICAVQKRKLPGQSFAKEITRDLARFVDFRQCKAWQWQPRRCVRHRRFCLGFAPTGNQLAPEFFVRPCAFHLIENEPVVLLNCFNDSSKLAHNDFVMIIASCLLKLSRTIDPRQGHDAVLRLCR